MGIDDKMKNAAKDASGKIKEGVGDATDNERLEAEGKAEQAGAKAKQAGENVKLALRLAQIDRRQGGCPREVR